MERFSNMLFAQATFKWISVSDRRLEDAPPIGRRATELRLH